MKDYPTGMHIFKIITDNKQVTKKIVKSGLIFVRYFYTLQKQTFQLQNK